jgi:hypothetical protein
VENHTRAAPDQQGQHVRGSSCVSSTLTPRAHRLLALLRTGRKTWYQLAEAGLGCRASAGAAAAELAVACRLRIGPIWVALVGGEEARRAC